MQPCIPFPREQSMQAELAGNHARPARDSGAGASQRGHTRFSRLEIVNSYMCSWCSSLYHAGLQVVVRKIPRSIISGKQAVVLMVVQEFFVSSCLVNTARFFLPRPAGTGIALLCL